MHYLSNAMILPLKTRTSPNPVPLQTSHIEGGSGKHTEKYRYFQG